MQSPWTCDAFGLNVHMCLQMHKIPDLEKLNIKDILSYGGAMQHGEERAKKHDKAASLYNHVSPLIRCGVFEDHHMGCQECCRSC